MALRIEHPVPGPADTHVVVVPMRRRHLRQVMRVESQVYPRPWTLGIFGSELAQGDRRCYLVAKVGSSVVGYCGALYSAEDAHITNIAVDPKWQRHQIATRLMLAIIERSLSRGASNLTLEVRVSNQGAQALYRIFGLAPAGIRPRYYENTEDAIVMWAEGLDTAAFAARLAAIEATVVGPTTVERGRR